jgi:hypothetical protein
MKPARKPSRKNCKKTQKSCGLVSTKEKKTLPSQDPCGQIFLKMPPNFMLINLQFVSKELFLLAIKT